MSSPWFTTAEACEHLRFDGPGKLVSLYRFLKAKGVPTVRRGERRILIARADLDEALMGKASTRRRHAIAKQTA